MKATCHFCGMKLETETAGVYQYVKGWERRRKGGGTNALRLPERFRLWACHGCIEGLVKGRTDQPALW